MYWINTMTAGWLSACFWHLPELDYWQIWSAQTMRSDCLPHIAGI